eukprot:scaffold50094_cov30-Tisochrysis_lutea.AAC.2
MKGIVSCAMAAPRLPHPAEVAFAAPTTEPENICEHHTWHVTKVASESPVSRRAAMKVPALLESASMMIPGIPSQSMRKKALRAPKTSQSGPAMMRMTIVPPTAAEPESAISGPLSPMPPSPGLRRMYGISAAGANTEKRVTKKPKVEAQKAEEQLRLVLLVDRHGENAAVDIGRAPRRLAALAGRFSFPRGTWPWSRSSRLPEVREEGEGGVGGQGWRRGLEVNTLEDSQHGRSVGCRWGLDNTDGSGGRGEQ